MRTPLLFIAVVLLSGFQDPPAKPDFEAELKVLRAEYKAAQQEYSRP